MNPNSRECLSRRSFLRLGLTGAAAALTAACGKEAPRLVVMTGIGRNAEEWIGTTDRDRDQYVLGPILEQGMGPALPINTLNLKGRALQNSGLAERWTLAANPDLLATELTVTANYANPINNDKLTTILTPLPTTRSATLPKEVTMASAVNLESLPEGLKPTQGQKLSYDQMRQILGAGLFNIPTEAEFSSVTEVDGTVQVRSLAEFSYMEPVTISQAVKSGAIGSIGGFILSHSLPWRMAGSVVAGGWSMAFPDNKPTGYTDPNTGEFVRYDSIQHQSGLDNFGFDQSLEDPSQFHNEPSIYDLDEDTPDGWYRRDMGILDETERLEKEQRERGQARRRAGLAALLRKGVGLVTGTALGLGYVAWSNQRTGYAMTTIDDQGNIEHTLIYSDKKPAALVAAKPVEAPAVVAAKPTEETPNCKNGEVSYEEGRRVDEIFRSLSHAQVTPEIKCLSHRDSDAFERIVVGARDVAFSHRRAYEFLGPVQNPTFAPIVGEQRDRYVLRAYYRRGRIVSADLTPYYADVDGSKKSFNMGLSSVPSEIAKQLSPDVNIPADTRWAIEFSGTNTGEGTPTVLTQRLVGKSQSANTTYINATGPRSYSVTRHYPNNL